MADIERVAVFVYGPAFFPGEDGKPRFAFRIDAQNRIGPREPTAEDIVTHQDLYRAAFPETAEQVIAEAVKSLEPPKPAEAIVPSEADVAAAEAEADDGEEADTEDAGSRFFGKPKAKAKKK